MYKLGFIGMGNMAGAIMEGLLKSHFIKESEMIAFDPATSAKEKIAYNHLVLAKDEREVIEKSDYIIIGVKPHILEGLLKAHKEILKGKAIISIVLGYHHKDYQKMLDVQSRTISVMPNTPVSVLEGMILLEEKNSLLQAEFEYVRLLFEALGQVEILPSQLFEAAGALSGCGPAYIYMVIEALGDGAVKNGVPRDVAYRLASQTVLGAAKMQLETQLHPGLLKDQVCSPGGSTIKGVTTLEKEGIRFAFNEAISASLKK